MTALEFSKVYIEKNMFQGFAMILHQPRDNSGAQGCEESKCLPRYLWRLVELGDTADATTLL